MQLVTFEVAGNRYALPAAGVRELLRAVLPSPLPKAVPFVEGVIDVRGTIVPVVEIRSRFGLPPKALAPSDHLILSDAGDRVVALRVDRVLDLVELDTADVTSVERQVPTARHIEGVARLPEGLAVIYDLSTFLSAAERDALDLAIREARA
jgi:purine-binding chemotaxis protein CheW